VRESLARAGVQGTALLLPARMFVKQWLLPEHNDLHGSSAHKLELVSIDYIYFRLTKLFSSLAES
jgi:hypothetical protein